MTVFYKHWAEVRGFVIIEHFHSRRLGLGSSYSPTMGQAVSRRQINCWGAA